MKKLALSILSMLYLVVACGFAVNIHYCMGHISNIDYTFQHSTLCKRCGMENKGCCHSDFKIIKLSDDQQKSKANPALAGVSIQATCFSISDFQTPQGLQTVSPTKYFSPPDKRLSRVYLHDCVFRI
jgi:hypothetical protein